MKHISTVIICITLFFALWHSTQLVSEYKNLKKYKEDLAEINKINYGLFNIRTWKEQALKVFENRVESFEISAKAYDEVVIELEKYLRGINKDYIESGKIFEGIFKSAENNPNMNKVFLKLIKENTAPQIKTLNIPSYIPGMARQLASELKKQEPRLRDIMREELKKILKDDDGPDYIDPRNAIFTLYNTQNINEANAELQRRIDISEKIVDQKIWFTFLPLSLIFLLTWLSSSFLGIVLSVTMMTLVSILVLMIGVNLPMIDIEALLNSFKINVLGTDIGFDKQYIYYQSKSILDVTDTLIKGRGFDIKLVGVMVLCFSIVFPLIKLILTGMFLYSNQLRNSKTVQNIIFYLGKWSMADVFVVALFMAYIGFYGIITSQLGAIERNDGGFAVETINNSSLAPGALYFTTYCIMSIILGIVVNKRVHLE